MLALLAGFIVPAVITSPFAGYIIVSGLVRHYFRKSDFHREAKRLQKRGYVALTKTDKGLMVKLLGRGRRKLTDIKFETLVLPKLKHWDGKWRLYSFDIPEEFKNARNMLRRKLKQMGCYNIQRSLFVYPYECREEMRQTSVHYKVEKYTLYAEASQIDIDRELRKFFQI